MMQMICRLPSIAGPAAACRAAFDANRMILFRRRSPARPDQIARSRPRPPAGSCSFTLAFAGVVIYKAAMAASPDRGAVPSGADPFASTHWSLVLLARERASPQADEALA